MEELGFLHGKVYIEGKYYATNLYITNGRVSAITTEELPCKKIIDVGGKKVLPGFIDPHVHFHLSVGANTSSDDFTSGSIKGALGGVTTYIDFLDPVKRADEIEQAYIDRMELAKNSATDYAFHTTIANPTDSAADIITASKEVGIPSIKLFTTYSNTDRRTKDDYIYELLKASKEAGVQIVIHSENDELVDTSDHILIKDHEHARPAITETMEVEKLARMAKEADGNLYIVHVSAGSTAKMLHDQYETELRDHAITLESCPHYFLLNSEMYEREDGYRYTMTPPLREESERQQLGKCLNAITTLATDHCPFEESLKKTMYTSDCPMGIGGIQYSFLNMYTTFGEQVIEKFTSGPALAYGLYPKKGNLLPGADGDVVILDDTKTQIITDPSSVYDGRKLAGVIEQVYLRGQLLVDHGVYQAGKGEYIRRTEYERY